MVRAMICAMINVCTIIIIIIIRDKVGPCHHGMARHQVADRGMVSSMEGSCEYIK
jgi:hypothetical protein